MNVTLDQMKAWDRWKHQIAMKKAQAERQAKVMQAMKKPAQEQLRLV